MSSSALVQMVQTVKRQCCVLLFEKLCVFFKTLCTVPNADSYLGFVTLPNHLQISDDSTLYRIPEPLRKLSVR